MSDCIGTGCKADAILAENRRLRELEQRWREEYALAMDNLKDCCDEIGLLRALLPGVYYMDPPDGGDVDIVEQFRRMAEDASRWRWWCNGRRDGLLSTQWNEWADRNRARAGKGAT